MKRHAFPSVRLALVPVVHGCDGTAALAAAQALAAEVVLVGLVPIMDGRPLSAGMPLARQVRRRLHEIAPQPGGRVRSKAAGQLQSTGEEDNCGVLCVPRAVQYVRQSPVQSDSRGLRLHGAH